MIERDNKIFYKYSEFSVDRNIDFDKIIFRLKQELSNYLCFSSELNNNVIVIYYKVDLWESEFFSYKSIKIRFIDYSFFQIQDLNQVLSEFLTYLKEAHSSKIILTMEVPADDKFIIQILNGFSFRMVETRLHYVNNRLAQFKEDSFPVRKATKKDIINLKIVAMEMRNDFDRFHSDLIFNNDIADEYLSKYIENSINGFADLVIVPNEKNINSDSFLTANILKAEWEFLEYKISKMVLSAVSAKTNKGWYYKLVSQMTCMLKSLGAQSIFLNTQATNIAVVATWEKLGYRFGRATHILTRLID
jgi:dTDP-4-amino-4,6-dideoxy-D-galactose acyltransferase